MPDIKLKNYSGEERIYSNVDKVYFPAAEGEQKLPYTYGEVVSKTVEPDFSGGNMDVPIAERELVKELTIKKPEALVPENIAEGMTIAGVGPGTHTGGSTANASLDDLFNKTISAAICPETLSIPQGAFISCSSLSVAEFPKCTSIGSSAFQYCSALTDICFPKCEYIGDNAFTGNGTSGYGAHISEADFPECSYIGKSAFYACGLLRSVSFPKCEYIGASAFGCYNSYYARPKLSAAYFPLVSYVGDYAFNDMSTLQIASFPECKTVGSSAFVRCSSLATAYFPKATYIGASAFYRCNRISDADFNKVITVGSCAFWNVNGWKGLTSTMFAALTIVGSYAFDANYGLSYIYLPSAKNLYSGAFRRCSALRWASLPMCSWIYGAAFESCNALMSLYLLGSAFVSLQNSSVFLSTPLRVSTYTGTFGSIFVRESMYASYMTKAYWSYYSSRFVSMTDEEIAALDAAWEETQE